MNRKYISIAFRNLGKGKVTNAINIIGLSLSMTAVLLIALWVQNELSFDSYHTHANRIMHVTTQFQLPSGKTITMEQSPLMLGNLASGQVPGIERVTQLNPNLMGGVTMQINGQYFKEKNGVYVDSNWFSTFDYDFVYGNAASFFSQPYNLLLTEPVAKKYFGNTNPVGKFVRIDTINYEVQGVVKENPTNSSFQYNIFIPLAARHADPKALERDRHWGNANFVTFLQLKPGADASQVARQLDRIWYDNTHESGATSMLIPLTDMHFEKGMGSRVIEHSNPNVVYIFEVLAGLLLLIACINYVNLTTARAGARVKEVSIKKIVGAGNGQLFMQFMTETAIVSILALVITGILVSLVLPYFNQLTGKNFNLDILSPVLWKIVGGTLLTAIVLNGIYPALLLSSFKPISIFRGVNVLAIKDTTLRKGLVITQFAISFVLITGAIAMYLQLQYIQQKDIGYQRDQVFELELPFTFYKKHPGEAWASVQAAIKQELQAQSSIKQVSNISESIIGLGSTTGGSLDWDGRDSAYKPSVTKLLGDEDLQSLLQLQLTAGRWFQPGNIADRKNYILNETAIREFNIPQPVVGRRFAMYGDTGQIIGIAKDFHFKSLHEKISPVVIYNAVDYRSSYYIKTSAAQVTQALAAAANVWKQFIPDAPFEYTFLDEQFALQYKSEQKVSLLMVIFAGIAILISCLGLLGLVIFMSEYRTKEIGIRKVLGATLRNIIILLSKDFIWLVFTGMAIATPAAWWAIHTWLQDFAYRIDISAWLFLLAALFALFIALITISFRAIKTATANPVIALRNE
jgi:putative ABC transport system permease protein